MNQQPRRLYIFTGKGGVGKTTLSKAFTRYLLEHDHEVVYLTFQNQSLGETHRGSTDKLINGIREISLDLEESARNYIEKKLNSKLVAGWIVKTPFFRALINMVPGFNYLIYLGKILDMQNNNPRLTVVLDAPASGHALTMVESTTNFKQIFESGIIFEDTGKMLSRLNDPSYTKIHVITLPGLMAWQEAVELKAGLTERTPVSIEITVNNCLYPLLENDLDKLPEGLKQKTINEKQLVEENRSQMLCVLSHSLKQDGLSIETDLVGSLSKLI
jgi:anion-transporting  ArsA/GET3 family ATPase